MAHRVNAQSCSADQPDKDSTRPSPIGAWPAYPSGRNCNTTRSPKSAGNGRCVCSATRSPRASRKQIADPRDRRIPTVCRDKVRALIGLITSRDRPIHAIGRAALRRVTVLPSVSRPRALAPGSTRPDRKGYASPRFRLSSGNFTANVRPPIPMNSTRSRMP